MTLRGAPPPDLGLTDALLAELAAAYETPRRHYHTFDHAFSVGRWVMTAHHEVGFEQVNEAYAAALFHDAIYDVSRKDNEAQSAELARVLIARHGLRVDADWVAQLILRTAEHGRAIDLTHDEAMFLDCDLSILGGDFAAYASYETGVAKEYLTIVPEALYKVGRRRFLERLLAGPSIFGTEYFRKQLEERARENLTRSLSAS